MSVLPSGSGVVFPDDGKAPDQRSTTKSAKKIIAASLEAGNSGFGNSGMPAADRVRAQKDSEWRYGYQRHLRALVEVMANPGNSVACAGAGLRAVHQEFRFQRDGQEEMPLCEAMSHKDRWGVSSLESRKFSGTFRTGVIIGKQEPVGNVATTADSVPCQGNTYTGAALHDLAKTFAAQGEAEASFADSIGEVAASLQNHPTRFSPPSDGVFVLIGATSEMGPCETLLKAGATVIALARKAGRGGPKRWEELCAVARASGGRLICPVGVISGEEGAKQTKDGADLFDFAPADIGADALVHTPEIVNWLFDLFTKHPHCEGKRPLIYSGIYLDGGKFVRASVAMEFIIHELTERLVDTTLNTFAKLGVCKVPALLYIDTPSHVHLLATNTFFEFFTGATKPNYNQAAPWWLRALSTVGLVWAPGNMKISDPSVNNAWSVADFSSVQQGPNYAVAKLIQRWRAIWSRHAGLALGEAGDHVPHATWDGEAPPRAIQKREKQLVSITTGPAAKTESVMHAKTMALVMKNIHLVPPNVAHEPETVRALMTLVMLRDLKSNKAMGNPNSVVEQGFSGDVEHSQHPMAFLVENAWHGGLWRSSYALDSAGPYLVAWSLYGKAISAALLAIAGAAFYGGLQFAHKY
jgi:hypothetical protein